MSLTCRTQRLNNFCNSNRLNLELLYPGSRSLTNHNCRWHNLVQLIIPKVLSTVLVSNHSFPIPIHYNTIISMAWPHCQACPVTAECIPSLSFAFDCHIQVLVTSESFSCSRAERVVDTSGDSLNQLKGILTLEFGCFLLDKNVLGFWYWENSFVAYKGGNVWDKFGQLWSIHIKSLGGLRGLKSSLVSSSLSSQL